MIMILIIIKRNIQNKCWLYYPDYENESELIFDEVDLKVTFVSERQEDFYTQRKFELQNLLVNIDFLHNQKKKFSSHQSGESRPIIHWSDFEWPDHGAPNSPEPFLQLLSDVRHCGAFDPRFGAPILHCSAGRRI